MSDMTQESLTADEYRTAAKVLRTKQVSDALGVYTTESKWFDTQAARLDAHAAGEAYEWDLALAYTDGYRTHADRPYSGGDDCKRAGIRAVLAKLEADGRLVDAPGDHPHTAWQYGYNAAVYDRSQQDAHGAEKVVCTANPYKLVDSTPEPVERCRCGVLEDEPSDGCEWHTARAEKSAELTARDIIAESLGAETLRWLGAGDVSDELAEAALNALAEAGFAAVKLPEERENGTYVSARVYGKGIKVFGEWIDADCARGVAADLLRAADQLDAIKASQS